MYYYHITKALLISNYYFILGLNFKCRQFKLEKVFTKYLHSILFTFYIVIIILKKIKNYINN